MPDDPIGYVSPDIVLQIVVPTRWKKRDTGGEEKEYRVTRCSFQNSFDASRPGIYKNALELTLDDGSTVTTDVTVREVRSRYGLRGGEESD